MTTVRIRSLAATSGNRHSARSVQSDPELIIFEWSHYSMRDGFRPPRMRSQS